MSVDSGDKPRGVRPLGTVLGFGVFAVSTYYFVFRGNIGTEYVKKFELTDSLELTFSATPTEMASLVGMAVGLLIMKASAR